MFLDGPTSDKSAPNTCLVGCKPESASGDAKDCPYRFPIHVDQVKFRISLTSVFNSGGKHCGMEPVVNPLTIMKGRVSATAMSWLAVSVLLLIRVGVVCRCDSVIDLMPLTSSSTFAFFPFFCE